MIWINLSDLAIEFLVIALSVLILSALAQKRTGMVLFRTVHVITVGFCVYALIHILTDCPGDPLAFCFWIIVPMAIFGLMERLTWLYPGEVCGIRLILCVAGIFFMSFYEEIYGQALIFKCQYAMFAIILISVGNWIIGGMDDCMDLNDPVFDWVYRHAYWINLCITMQIVLLSIIGVLGSIFTEDNYVPLIIGYGVMALCGCIMFFIVSSIGHEIYCSNLVCQMFMISFGLFYIVSGALKGQISVTGVILLAAPIAYFICYLYLGQSFLIYIPWFIYTMAMLFLTIAAPYYIFTSIGGISLGELLKAMFCISLTICTGLIVVNMCTVSSPFNLSEMGE